jgi:hypothetical protein
VRQGWTRLEQAPCLGSAWPGARNCAVFRPLMSGCNSRRIGAGLLHVAAAQCGDPVLKPGRGSVPGKDLVRDVGVAWAPTSAPRHHSSRHRTHPGRRASTACNAWDPLHPYRPQAPYRALARDTSLARPLLYLLGTDEDSYD